MKGALLLFLSADRLHAQSMAGGKITLQREFPGSPEGREDFALFLHGVKHPAYLLVDLIEEDFRQETVPHLGGSKRAALLQRKFDQFYRNTPFHQATLLQRQRTGRHDDDMLFSALTNPSLITPWVDIMLAQKIPLAGVYSVPQISAPLVENHPSEHLLLISWEKFSGLRQTYFSEHRLQISRLTPVHADLAFHDAVVNELTRTYQYLKSLSLLPPGQTLDVRILCHRDDREALRATLPGDADMRYDFVDLADIAGQLGIEHPPADSDASQIFLRQLTIGPPKSHYANARHTHHYDLWRLRRTLNRAGGALLSGCLLWGAAGIWQSGSDAGEADIIRERAQRTLNEAQQIIRHFPNTYAPASDMKAGVSAMHKLNRYGASPDEILRPVSEVLDNHPQIWLDDLAWQVGAPGSAPENTPADTPVQIVTLKGHLTGFAKDYRAALDCLERFQRDLAARGYRVVALARPLDISPGGSIADQREALPDALGFSLKIFRGAQP